jgi:hypothetical protein
MARADDDARRPKRESCGMNAQATSFAYISSDVPEQLTLREFGRELAAQHTTGDSRLKRAVHGLRLGQGALRLPTPRFA